MDVKAILNMDMAALGQVLRRGWAWWLGELAGLLPRSVRERTDARRLALSLEGDSPVLRRLAAQGWETVYKPSRRQVEKAVLALPREMALVGEFDFPVPSAADLYRMVALELNRLTPFQPDEVVFDVEVLGDVPGKGIMRRIALAVVRRRDLGDIKARLDALGLSPAGIALADGQRLRFDFARREAAGATGRAGLALRVLRWAVPVLLLVNVSLLVLRDQMAVDGLRETVESQRLQVQLVERLRKRVEAEEARRQDLLARRQAQAPLPVLAAVTALLPDSAWATLFEWNGTELRLTGISQVPLDVPALLAASPLLRNVRPADGVSGEGAFGITAVAAGGTP